MKQELADIATNERKRLQGMKVLGVFPFYLQYITTGTHIQLCKIKDQLQECLGDREPKVSDFFDTNLQEKITPLVRRYVVTGLLNDRPLSWFFRPLLNRKIKTCGHSHILNLYITITKLNEPAFFLTYWRLINQKDNTLLKEATQS